MLTVYVSHFQVPVNNSSIVQEIIKAPSETGLVCDPVQEQQQRQRKEDVSFSSSDNANANTNIYYSQEEDSATTTHVSSEPSSKSNYTFTSKRKQSCIDSFIPKKNVTEPKGTRRQFARQFNHKRLPALLFC